MKSEAWKGRIRVGQWVADNATGDLCGPEAELRLEPKVMDLLYLLASHAGQPVARGRIMAALWPGLVVGEDSLARTVSKLRQALGDDAKSPRYVETLAKRGYRLLAEVELLASDSNKSVMPPQAKLKSGSWRAWALAGMVAVLAIAIGALAWSNRISSATSTSSLGTEGSNLLLARADDYYFQFSRSDNEAAIELYERVLGLRPDDPNALAGLANALVQRCIRWPMADEKKAQEFTRLGDALANGHLQREPARAQLQRARRLAQRAVAVSPESSVAYKSLGFVSSAQGQFEPALGSYKRAVQLDHDAWGAMINIGDLLEIMGRGDEALPYFERAYAAMSRVYARNPVQVRPWYAPLGVLIAERYRARGDLSAAETWYRRVLAEAPMQRDAIRGLAAVLKKGGDSAGAERLCMELERRLGPDPECQNQRARDPDGISAGESSDQ